MFCMCRSIEVRPKLLCRWYQGSEAGDRPSFSFHSRLCLQGSSSGALPPTEDSLPLHRRPVLTVLGAAGANFYNCCCDFYCFSQGQSRRHQDGTCVSRTQRQGHRLESAVHAPLRGKTCCCKLYTFLFTLGSNLMFVRCPGYRGFAATRSRRRSITRARRSTTRTNKMWSH